MRKLTGFSLLGVLLMVVGISPVRAQVCPSGNGFALSPCAQMQFHGGPILQNFTIYPLYFGEWAQSDIDTQQAFLSNLAAYISGENAPRGQQPTVWQYGPRKATVQPALKARTKTSPDEYASTCFGNLTQEQIQQYYGNQTQYYPSKKNPAVAGTLYFCDIPEIINNNQARAVKPLPAYGPETLIVVFTAPGFQYDPACNCLGYHSSLSDSAFFATVSPTYYPGGPYTNLGTLPQIVQFQAATSHEIFEDATDAADNNFNGWVSVACRTYTSPDANCTTPAGITFASSQEEVADQCETVVSLDDWPGGVPLQFAAIVDNTLNGACSTTGYMPLVEDAMYGMSPAVFDAQNQTELDKGYQLYILGSYVFSDGDRHYNAVWRPQAPGTPAVGTAGPAPYQAAQLVDRGYAPPYKPRFDSLQSMGWRLYTFHTAAQGSSPLYYDAVWRQSTSVLDTKENGYFEISYDQFRAEYESNFPSPNDWRLYGLQTTISDVTIANGPAAGQDWIDAVWHYPDGVNVNLPTTSCTCSDEQHVYGWTRADYLTEYTKLAAIGYRLYLLDPYVISDGTVRYNAIFRASTVDEVPIYGYTYKDYLNEYEKQYANGYRLYILEAYVLPGDEVRYDAVFRPGVFDRPL
jgi:hypothetical protein